MSKLDDLINKFCPDGVEYKKLGILSELYAGATPKTTNPEYWENGTIPWMSSGEVNLGQVFNTEKRISQLGYDSCSTKMVPANSVVVALAGQGKTRGTVAITRIELCTNQSLCSIIPNNELCSDFLYHYMKGQYQTLRKISSGDGTRGGLNLKMLYNFEIPVPPLEVQNEIVRILDKFTSLEAELEAELEARRKQYEYYRDTLLLKNKNAEWKTLAEIGTFERGRRFVHGDDREEGTPCIHYGELYTYYGVWADEVKTHIDPELKTKLRFAEKNDVVIVGAGENNIDIGVAVAWLGDYKVAIHDACYIFRHKQNPKYISYLLRTYNYHLQIKKYVSEGKICSISAEGIGKAKLPFPSLEEQEKIVSILDRFESLCNDITSGLPAEIEARHKQYEYYRDKLLTFKRKEI